MNGLLVMSMMHFVWSNDEDEDCCDTYAHKDTQTPSHWLEHSISGHTDRVHERINR